jgi:hypothetical protein
LRTAGTAGMPAESRAAAPIRGLFAGDEGFPGFMNQGLVQQAIDNARVHPLALGHARFEMACHVLDVSFASRMKGRTETASPVLALTQESHHLLGVRARLATMALLVMLVERVGTPEAAIAPRLRARIFPPAFMELVFMALPIVFALEARLTRRAPIDILFIDSTTGANLTAVHERRAGGRVHRGRHGEGSLHP